MLIILSARLYKNFNTKNVISWVQIWLVVHKMIFLVSLPVRPRPHLARFRKRREK